MKKSRREYVIAIPLNGNSKIGIIKRYAPAPNVGMAIPRILSGSAVTSFTAASAGQSLTTARNSIVEDFA